MIALVKRDAADTDLALIDVPPAAVPVGHVRVAVAASGVCGTDLHIRDGSYNSFPPVVLGHEVSGVVVELGDGVDSAWLDAAVAAETFFSVDGTCDRCREGRPNLCANRRSIGSGAGGGFTASLVVPAINLHRLPASLETVYGALCEPLACVCQSLLDPARVQPGDRVVVTGPGPVGLLAAQVARVMGGTVTVLGTARDTARLDAAAALGIGIGYVEDLNLTPRFDVAVECSGAGPAMAMNFELLRPGGRYVQMGQTDTSVSLRFALVSFKELEISGGFASTPRSWNRALELLETEAVDVRSLVTEIAPLSEWERVFSATANSEGLKYLLRPESGA